MEGARCPLQPIGEQLAHVITEEQEEHEGAADPYCASNGIYIPCLCVITFHTLHPLLLLTYADPIFKVRACAKAQKLFFLGLFVSLMLTTKCLSVYFHLFNLLKTEVKIRPCITKTKRKERQRIHQKKKKTSWRILSLKNNTCTELEINIISATT